jgi:hypothetical protein
MAAAPSFIPATIGLTGIPATSVGQTGNIATIAGHTTTDGIETNDEAMSIATTETINVIAGTRPTIALTTRLATARMTTPTVVSQPNGSPATFSAAKLRLVLPGQRKLRPLQKLESEAM